MDQDDLDTLHSLLLQEADESNSDQLADRVQSHLAALLALEDARQAKLQALVQAAESQPLPRQSSPVEDDIAEQVAHLTKLEADLKAELLQLQQAHAAMDAAEDHLHYVHAVSLREAEAVAVARESHKLRLAHTNQLLSDLSHINALNLSFHIATEGLYATVNRLRLGNTLEDPVEWAEMNLALGMCALLLDAAMRDAQFDSPVWFVVPNGNTSYMQKTKSGRQAPLYWNGGFWMVGFNEGLAAFAQCVAELGQQAAKMDPAMALPYAIQSGTINGLPLSYEPTVEWARAIKFLLTDLKWVVAWRAKARRQQLQL